MKGLFRGACVSNGFMEVAPPTRKLVRRFLHVHLGDNTAVDGICAVEKRGVSGLVWHGG